MSVAETLDASRRALVKYFSEVPPVILPGSTIAGHIRPDPSYMNANFPDSGLLALGDNFHYPMGTAYLELGVGGVAETARKKIDPINKNAEQNLLLGCVADVYEAFSAYIGRYAAHAAEALAAAAEDAAERARLSAVAAKLRGIVREPPHSFAEAVQLFYLTWRARCINATSCIGRLDMHLWPFYQKDIEKGIVTRESALEQLLALWKLLNLCGSGDTLINVMVGGRDAEGSDMTKRPVGADARGVAALRQDRAAHQRART